MFARQPVREVVEDDDNKYHHPSQEQRLDTQETLEITADFRPVAHGQSDGSLLRTGNVSGTDYVDGSVL